MSEIISDRPPGRRELQKRERRQVIVAAARAAFLDEGYAAMSMSGLLKTLGGSKATLWGHFRTKEDLFAAVVEDLAQELHIELDGVLALNGPLQSTIAAFCRHFMTTLSQPEAVAAWRLVASESGRFPEIGRIFHDHAVRRTREVLADFLSHHISAGNLCSDDPLKMADMLESLCVSRQSRLLWMIDGAEIEPLEDEALRYTDYFVRAFAV